MIIINDINEIEKFVTHNTAIALGKFDGLHRGHLEIIKKLCNEKTNGLNSLVFTFSKNPKNQTGKRLFTREEQMLVYERLGIDIVIVYPVESGILEMSAQEFVKKILVEKLGVKKIFCGENFRFGKGRTGDKEKLKILGEQYGFETEVIKLVRSDGDIISSTDIRKLITIGELEKAYKLMGHRYSLVGKVVHGNMIGRTLNTPTANIYPDEEKIMPPNGVYVSCCNIDGTIYKGVTNIGYKPTIDEKQKKLGVETYFLDFEGNLYDKILQIELVTFIREEEKFSSIEALKLQLKEDKRVATEMEILQKDYE